MFENTQFWDELAVKSYRDILKKNPKNPLIHKNLGLAYQRLGKLNKAIRSFERAIKWDKRYKEALYHLGCALQKMGKKAEAIRAFCKYNNLQEEEKGKAPVVDDLLEQLSS